MFTGLRKAKVSMQYTWILRKHLTLYPISVCYPNFLILELGVHCSGKVVNTPRSDYLGWDEYFMAVAFLSAQRSKDPNSQVGACITNNEKKIVGIGYNGMPNGCKDSDLPWGKTDNWLESKYPYVCHAELNAVLNKNSSDVKGCKIYVALFPCNECAKVIIQSGIKEVVYYSDKYYHKPTMIASKKLFDLAGVTYRQYVPEKRQITIDFSVIDPDVQPTGTEKNQNHTL